MKEQSTRILSEVVLRCVYNEGEAVKNGDEAGRGEWVFVRERLIQVMRAEQPSTSNAKFNLWNYVSKEDNRPQMCGIYHEGGYKVASDCHILVFVKDEYPDNMEGKILLKNGSFVDECYQYPRWRSVVPSPDGRTTCTPDLGRYYDALGDYKTGRKAGILNEFYVKVGPALFKGEAFKLMADYMRVHGVSGLLMKDGITCAYAEGPDGSGCILMPVAGNHNDEAGNEGVLIVEI